MADLGYYGAVIPSPPSPPFCAQVPNARWLTPHLALLPLHAGLGKNEVDWIDL